MLSQGLSIVVIGLLTVMVAGDVGCRNSHGDIVDWFIIYKLPMDENSSNSLIREGTAHMYLDVHHQSFVLSDVSMNSTKQALAKTLEFLYSKDREPLAAAHLFYNDEIPTSKVYNFTFGHTKGVIAFDESFGFWLVQSAPKFPNVTTSNYYWPHNALEYGQSALCITLPSAEMETIGKQIMYNYPRIYDHNLPNELLKIAPSIGQVVKGKHMTGKQTKSKAVVTSTEGQRFTVYSKTSSFGRDLYSSWLAEDLEANLKTETWQHEDILCSNCSTGSGYDVINVKSIEMKVLAFSEYVDHSKWAITDESSKIVCIGDINREEGQSKRGGGTVCANLPQVWEQYNNMIASVYKCPSK